MTTIGAMCSLLNTSLHIYLMYIKYDVTSIILFNISAEIKNKILSSNMHILWSRYLSVNVLQTCHRHFIVMKLFRLSQAASSYCCRMFVLTQTLSSGSFVRSIKIKNPLPLLQLALPGNM